MGVDGISVFLGILSGCVGAVVVAAITVRVLAKRARSKKRRNRL